MDIEAILDFISNEHYKNEEIEQTCCRDFYPIENEGYVSCGNCGVVHSTQIYDTNIFGFENGDDNRFLRSFPNLLYPIASTSSSISGNSKISKMANWNSMPYNEKVIWEISKELKSKIQNSFSNRVIEDTLFIYKKFYENSASFRGGNKKGFVAVCLYIASQNNFHIVSPKKIAEIIGIDNKTMTKCIRKYYELTEEFKKVLTSVDFINSFYDQLAIDQRTKKHVTKICETVEKHSILGGALPQNICISVIGFVCSEMKCELDLQRIEDEFIMSKITILKNIKLLEKNKQLIFQHIKNSKKD
jgi:transcription initiation factor TFIIIB Brf1 subunit/transcription initiation factor TFIIB